MEFICSAFISGSLISPVCTIAVCAKKLSTTRFSCRVSLPKEILQSLTWGQQGWAGRAALCWVVARGGGTCGCPQTRQGPGGVLTRHGALQHPSAVGVDAVSQRKGSWGIPSFMPQGLMSVSAHVWPELPPSSFFPLLLTGDGCSKMCGVLPGTPQLCRDAAPQVSVILTPLSFFPYFKHFRNRSIFQNCWELFPENEKPAI